MKSIFHLLTLNFVKLVLISIVLATPISLYLMQEWLSEFAYRIEIGWQFFVVAGILSLGIAILTISYQSLRAALMNPVNSLKEQ